MAFSDPFITLHEMPRIRLWEELRDNMRDRRRVLEQIAGWYPSTPAMPSLYQLINRLTYPSGSYLRGYIDNVADAVFDDDTVVEGPAQPTLKTKAKIHLDAFGFDDNGWDAPGPPDLTHPCTPHSDAWDHVRKVILEVDKHWHSPWTYDVWLPLTKQGDYYEYNPYTNPRFDSWSDAKQNALDNMSLVEENYHYYIGRSMHGYRYPDGSQKYICDAYAVTGYWAENVFGWDVTQFNEVPTLSKVFLGIKWGGEDAGGNYQRSPVNIDIYIGNHKCNSTKLALDCTSEDYQIYLFELDAFDQSNYTFDGTKYNIEARFAEAIDGWVDDSEFPAPGLGENKYWMNRVDARPYAYGSPNKFFYVKPYYFFVWT